MAQDQVGVKMADNGLLELREFLADRFLLPKERQGCGIMAEKQDALIRSQR